MYEYVYTYEHVYIFHIYMENPKQKKRKYYLSLTHTHTQKIHQNINNGHLRVVILWVNFTFILILYSRQFKNLYSSPCLFMASLSMLLANSQSTVIWKRAILLLPVVSSCCTKMPVSLT